MDKEIELRNSKNRLTLYYVLTFFGALLLIVGLIFLSISLKNIIGDALQYSNHDLIIKAIKSHLSDLFLNSIIFQLGAALIIIFSILTSKQKKLVDNLKSN